MDVGHYLLIVTKPNQVCINKMITGFNNCKEKVLFRLTITSNNDDILEYYENKPSRYNERKNYLVLLFNSGYKTYISMGNHF